MKKILIKRRAPYLAALGLLFLLLVLLSVPERAVFGSHTDWLSQHVTLAETIRSACLEQGTLLPTWIRLGGGSNGFQFAYYGFLRPDLLIGCLLPEVPMIRILTGYMLAVYAVSVLLCFLWLESEDLPRPLAFAGSVLFLTAGCLFHIHRQIMFVNYLPFLLLAFLCVRKGRIRLLPLCLALICLSSFYFSVSAFAAVAWYWYQKDGREFLRAALLRRFLPCAVLAAAMSAALLLPTAYVLLEHGRSGGGFSLLRAAELFAPNPMLNNLLFNEYGMGLSFLCLYPLLAGLSRRATRRGSLFFLCLGLFGVFSWLLNGTLYARPKSLIPFMPLVILHCVRYLQDTAVPAWSALLPADPPSALSLPETREKQKLPLWPFAFIFPCGLLWFSQPQFPWILAEAVLLFLLTAAQRILVRKRRGPTPRITERAALRQRYAAAGSALILILVSPICLFLSTAGTEDWVARDETSAGISGDELETVPMDPLYHFDSLVSPLVSGNELPKSGMTRSTMYSSVTGQAYSEFYYDTLMTPIRINNRTALLTSENPFLLDQLSVRYLEVPAGAVPAGYREIFRSGDTVIAENPDVLPSVYFTGDAVSEEWFETLEPMEKLSVLMQRTVADDTGAEKGRPAGSPAGSPTSEGLPDEAALTGAVRPFTPEVSFRDALPDGLEIRKTGGALEITADRTCTLSFQLSDLRPDAVLLLGFHVENKTAGAVVIDINGIRNKLSGMFAPYPNGNERFEYQFFSGEKEGPAEFSVTFSKGRYVLSDIRWHMCSAELLNAKAYTPLEPDPGTGRRAEPDPPQDQNAFLPEASGTVLSGSVTAPERGYLATSIPVQDGLEILVDDEPSEIVTVNEAFAGTELSPGTHRIEIRFSPPGKTAGIALSCTASAGYLIFLLCECSRRNLR